MSAKPATLAYARMHSGPPVPRRRWWRVVVGFIAGTVCGYAIGGMCISWWGGPFSQAPGDVVFGMSVVAAIAGCLLVRFKRPFLGGLLFGSGFGLFLLALVIGLASALRS